MSRKCQNIYSVRDAFCSNTPALVLNCFSCSFFFFYVPHPFRACLFTTYYFVWILAVFLTFLRPQLIVRLPIRIISSCKNYFLYFFYTQSALWGLCFPSSPSPRLCPKNFICFFSCLRVVFLLIFSLRLAFCLLAPSIECSTSVYKIIFILLHSFS